MGIETPQENISHSSKKIVVEVNNSNQNDSLDYPKDRYTEDTTNIDTFENNHNEINNNNACQNKQLSLAE